MQKYGTYPKAMLRDLMSQNIIQGGSEGALNPGSLNLCLTGEMFRLNSFQQPSVGQSVWAMMKEVGFSMHHPSHPCEVGLHYIARLQERLELPEDLYGYANPRSTTGRQFVHTRVLVNGDPGLDQVPRGYRGELWALIRCLAFPGVFSEGDQLTQLRVFNKDTRLSLEQVKEEHRKTPLVVDHEGKPISFENLRVDRDGSVYLHLNLKPVNGPAAYVSRQTNRPAFFSKPNPKDEFFKALFVETLKLGMKEKRFYITTSDEGLCLPGHITAEIAPMDERIIEARNNFAGFVDQGFSGQITCEMAVQEPLTLTHRQVVARVRFEYVCGDNHDVYEGSYQGQSGPKLAKNFV